MGWLSISVIKYYHMRITWKLIFSKIFELPFPLTEQGAFVSVGIEQMIKNSTLKSMPQDK